MLETVSIYNKSPAIDIERKQRRMLALKLSLQ